MQKMWRLPSIFSRSHEKLCFLKGSREESAGHSREGGLTGKTVTQPKAAHSSWNRKQDIPKKG